MRAAVARKRDLLGESDRADKSRAIARRLYALPGYRAATTVMFFHSCRSEVVTGPVIEEAFRSAKRVALPVADTAHRTLAAVAVSPGEPLRPGPYGILEPGPSLRAKLPPGEIDLVIVPGIAFDEAGNRLGYGKGYYDAWLGRFERWRRVALAFEVQIVGSVPADEKDIPVGVIVTEKRTIFCRDLNSTKGAT